MRTEGAPDISHRHERSRLGSGRTFVPPARSIPECREASKPCPIIRQVRQTPQCCEVCRQHTSHCVASFMHASRAGLPSGVSTKDSGAAATCHSDLLKTCQLPSWPHATEPPRKDRCGSCPPTMKERCRIACAGKTVTTQRLRIDGRGKPDSLCWATRASRHMPTTPRHNNEQRHCCAAMPEVSGNVGKHETRRSLRFCGVSQRCASPGCRGGGWADGLVAAMRTLA